MGKGIPVPENDWIALNIRLDEMTRDVSRVKVMATTASGLTVEEEQNQMIINDNPPIPSPGPGPGPGPSPGPSPVLLPVIQDFTISPTSAPQSKVLGPGYCDLTPVTISWTVLNSKIQSLVRTAMITGGKLVYTVLGASGTTVISVAQKTSWLLKAKNETGEVASNELVMDVVDNPIPPISPIPPIPPQTLDPPQNFAGSVQNRFLVFTWDHPTNDDFKYIQLYASKTTGFDPDNNPPSDMIYRISFGNQTNIGVHTAAEVWYGKVRQVATSGKSAFSPEYALTAT